MIARTLLFVKHRIPWLWEIVDWVNTVLYRALHRKRMQQHVARAFSEFGLDGFEFRSLCQTDLGNLNALIQKQGEERLRYFRPHGFDTESLRRAQANPAFMMFGVLHGSQLVGYFFLRCFWNRKCFVGRLIDRQFEGRGIGRVMNQIMYHGAWWSGFRCMTTVSKHNMAIMRSHRNNVHAHTLSELSSDYLLIEFLPAPVSDVQPQRGDVQ